MNISSFQHYLIGLLAIGNNISALGAFLLHTQGMPRAKVKRLILMSSLACFITLVLFMLVGTWILDFFGISVSAFQIAGGLLLGGVGLEMMNSRTPVPTDTAAQSLTRVNAVAAQLPTVPALQRQT